MNIDKKMLGYISN